MQEAFLSQSTLEEFYSRVILPQFGLRGKHIIWQEHQTIGPDNEMHVFSCDDDLMVLVFDDFPTTTASSLQEEFMDRAVTQVSRDQREEGSVTIDDTITGSDDRYILGFGPDSLPFTYVYNVTGYFQLFRLEPRHSMYKR